MNIYYIGGSPCAGKSSVAEILSRRYGLNYFKVDVFWIDICRQAHDGGMSYLQESSRHECGADLDAGTDTPM